MFKRSLIINICLIKTNIIFLCQKKVIDSGFIFFSLMNLSEDGTLKKKICLLSNKHLLLTLQLFMPIFTLVMTAIMKSGLITLMDMQSTFLSGFRVVSSTYCLI